MGRLAPSPRAAVRPHNPRTGRRRPALRAGGLRGAQGLPPRRRLDLDLPARGQRRAHAALGRAARPARAAHRLLHRVAQAAHRARRPVGAIGPRDEPVPAALHVRQGGVPRGAAREEGRLHAHRQPGRRVLPRWRRAGLDLGFHDLRAGRSRRHGRREDRRQLRLVARRAAGGVRPRLRTGAVPRRRDEHGPRGARRHERRARAQGRHPGHARLREHPRRHNARLGPAARAGPRAGHRAAAHHDRRGAPRRRVGRHRGDVRVRHGGGHNPDRRVQGRRTTRSATRTHPRASSRSRFGRSSPTSSTAASPTATAGCCASTPERAWRFRSPRALSADPCVPYCTVLVGRAACRCVGCGVSWRFCARPPAVLAADERRTAPHTGAARLREPPCEHRTPRRQ